MQSPGVIGVVTIGQTPRPDLENAFARHARGARIHVRGALDGMSPDAIENAASLKSDYPLLVRLADSSTREIPLEFLHPLVAEQARQLEGDGVAVVAIACAGGFPTVECDVPVLLPGRLLPALAGALTTNRRIGVVVPIRAQAHAALRKWADDGFDPVVTWASPQISAAPPPSATPRDIESEVAAEMDTEMDAAIAPLRHRGLTLTVLDCFGHGDEYATEFARRAGMPVLAAQTVTARLAGELVRA